MVYAYLRVSTGKQDGANQRLGVEDLAKRLNLTIDKYIDDEGVSGTKEPEKRELGNLLKMLKPGDVILAGEISRLGRSLFMVMRILEFCLNNGVKVYTAKDGYELGDNVQSKVLAFAFGLAAEIEREMISRRTKEALAKRRLEGVVLGRPKGSKSSKVKMTGHDDEIRRMLDAGTPVTEIARVLGVNRNTASNYIHNYMGIGPIRHAENQLLMLDEHEDEIARMVEAGMTRTEIARELRASYGAVKKYVDRRFGAENVAMHDKYARKLDGRDAEILGMIGEKLTLAEMCERLGCGRTALQSYMKDKMGIQPVPQKRGRGRPPC